MPALCCCDDGGEKEEKKKARWRAKEEALSRTGKSSVTSEVLVYSEHQPPLKCRLLS
jgi:hypothetical protein